MTDNSAPRPAPLGVVVGVAVELPVVVELPEPVVVVAETVAADPEGAVVVGAVVLESLSVSEIVVTTPPATEAGASPLRPFAATAY